MSVFPLRKKSHPGFFGAREHPNCPFDVDFTHPFLKGVQAMYAARPGEPRDEVTQTKLVQLNSNWKLRGSGYGQGVTNSSGATALYTAHNLPGWDTTEDYRFWAHFLYEDTVNYSYLVGQQTARGIALRNTANDVYFYDGSIRGASDSVIKGRVHTILAQRVGGFVEVWVDGERYYNWGSSNIAGSGQIIFLAQKITGNFSVKDDRSLYCGGYALGSLSPGEIRNYARCTSQIFTPRAKFSVVTPAAAVGPGGFDGKWNGQSVTKFNGATIEKIIGVD